jgi:serine/threonine protein kinase
LSGATRITRIIIGIALAVQFIHSRSVIHCDLKPDNILLDFDWIVQIADFGQSIAPNIPNICSLAHSNGDRSFPSIDSRCLAPDCYDHIYSQMSDVFSFGLIVYELLTGQPTFAKELTYLQMMYMVAMEHTLPDIPKSVLPSAKELIMDCLAIDPGDRPSFEEIVCRLKETKFKLLRNVYSRRLSDFVKKIEEWEAKNSN